MPVEPRRPKGPPLNALRAFEAAARLGSFVLAADELGVTPGAVSQHIKSVEAWAGTALFTRNAQGIALLPAARALSEEYTRAFDQLATATQRLRNLAPNLRLHIAALPAVAQLWLPQRLGKLREKRPDLSVSVTALETPPSLSRDLFDMSLFLDVPGRAPDQIVLAEDLIFPVCAPDLETGHDFATVPLLHDQTWQNDWSMWSQATGTDVGNPARGARYSLYALAVEEAKSGAGALMGHGCLIEQMVQAGDLRPMSPQTVSTGKALILQLPHPSRRHPEIADIVDMLRDIQHGPDE